MKLKSKNINHCGENIKIHEVHMRNLKRNVRI